MSTIRILNVVGKNTTANVFIHLKLGHILDFSVSPLVISFLVGLIWGVTNVCMKYAEPLLVSCDFMLPGLRFPFSLL